MNSKRSDIRERLAKGAKLKSKPVLASSQITSGRYCVYTEVFTTLEAAGEARDKITKSIGFNPVVRKKNEK